MSWWWLVALLAVAVGLQVVVVKVNKTVFSLLALFVQLGMLVALYFLGATLEQVVVYAMAQLFVFMVLQLSAGRKE